MPAVTQVAWLRHRLLVGAGGCTVSNCLTKHRRPRVCTARSWQAVLGIVERRSSEYCQIVGKARMPDVAPRRRSPVLLSKAPEVWHLRREHLSDAVVLLHDHQNLG